MKITLVRGDITRQDVEAGAYGYPLAEAAAVSVQALCGAVTAIQSVLLVAFSSQVQELWEQALNA